MAGAISRLTVPAGMVWDISSGTLRSYLLIVIYSRYLHLIYLSSLFTPSWSPIEATHFMSSADTWGGKHNHVLSTDSLCNGICRPLIDSIHLPEIFNNAGKTVKIQKSNFSDAIASFLHIEAEHRNCN